MSAARREGYPLSSGQERLWLLERLRPGTATYNVPVVYDLRGRLAVEALRRAIDEVVQRHAVLRTTFRSGANGPEQVIHPPSPPAAELVDLSGLPAAAREEEALAGAAELVARPFTLESDRPFRARLVRLAEEHHLMALVFHHVATDGWSRGVLLRELSVLYAAFSEGRPSPLPPLPIQYADFAAWERETLESGELQEELAVWRRELSGCPLVLPLPTDRRRPALPRGSGAVCRFRLPGAIAKLAAARARDWRLTPFMVYLAAFHALLARWAEVDDLVVGVPFANRGEPETEPLIGFFASILPVRGELHGDPSFASLARRVGARALTAYGHQALPFEQLVQAVRPERDFSRAPVVQAALALQDVEPEALDLPGVAARPVPADTGTSRFDLSLALREDGSEIVGAAEYAAELFDAVTVERLVEAYGTLLREAVEHPDLPVSRLPLMDSRSAAAALAPGRGAEAPPGVPLLPQIELRARIAPGAEAVYCERERLTFADLDRRSRAVVTRLRGLGVGADSVVAVCAERSSRLVATLLGVLRAGAAYLPLDPDGPPERLAWMIRDADARVVVACGASRKRLPALPVPVLSLEGLDSGGAGEDEIPEPHPEQLAYVTYTSGSTGVPKGVAVAHRGLQNLLAWHLTEYGITPADRATQVASPAFDAFGWEIWPYLAAGAAVHVVPDAVRAHPTALLRTLEAESITISFLPTPLAEAVLAAAESQDAPAPRLRVLLTGGDTLRLAGRGAPWPLVNHYGPTEATVVSTRAAAEGPLPPIGRPLPGTSAQVLDRHLQPVLPGAPGELCVGGAGLARGYVGRPSLTAESFVPDPHAGVPGARLYRTGDRASRREDGNLVFLGRMDRQLKVRGHRIEVGEVEAALLRHPGVREAVVALRDAPAGGPALTAYVIDRGDGAPSARELREHLGGWLPASAVPAHFVALEALPLTPNGKLDLHALPLAPATAAPSGPSLPESSAEASLLALWREVLGVALVGREDSFFDLGGHSLLMARLHDLIRERLGWEVSLVDLLRYPTVALLAARFSGPHGTAAPELPDQGDPAAAERLAARRRRARAAHPN